MAEDLEFKSYTYQSGAVYEGTFKGTKRHGKGHWRHPEGEVYEGEYQENKQQGRGIYVFGATGKKYIGDWAVGEMAGRGIYYFSAKKNSYYVGQYEHDKKHGSGFYMYDNGVMTLQTWINGEMTGESEAQPADRVECASQVHQITTSVRRVAPKELGAQPENLEVKTFQFPSGATYSGQYSGTKKYGQGHWVHPDGDSFEGNFENNKLAGWGVYITGRSGKKFVGQWDDGKMDGWGIYFFNQQETEYFIGQYREDKKDGAGMYHFADSGQSKAQVWEKGALVKEFDADETTVMSYLAAMKKVIEIVQPVAPNYKPLHPIQ